MILEANSSDDTVKIILIYLYTGMRLGELLKCKRSDVDIDGRVIIGGSKTKAVEKGVSQLSKNACR